VIDGELERPRALAGASATFADAVTFAFGDPRARLYGLARVGLSPDPDRGDGRLASALGVLFSDGAPVAALGRGGVELDAGADFADLALPGLRTTVEAPLERWRVELDAGDDYGSAGFSLTFKAIGGPAELARDEPAARAGGMEGYEQLCRVRGSVRTPDGREQPVEGLGQRGHSWGEPDWSRIELARTIGAWLDDGSGLTLTSVRPEGAASHADEQTWAALLGGPDEGTRVEEPRLSTTTDASGRQRRAGLELWLAGDDGGGRGGRAYYAAGEAVCGSTVDLGRLRLECAFFEWHMEGRSGIGRYDVLRRA
jgi:hypothetical protein